MLGVFWRITWDAILVTSKFSENISISKYHQNWQRMFSSGNCAYWLIACFAGPQWETSEDSSTKILWYLIKGEPMWQAVSCRFFLSLTTWSHCRNFIASEILTPVEVCSNWLPGSDVAKVEADRGCSHKPSLVRKPS